MAKRVSDLTPNELDYWVARARGWTVGARGSYEVYECWVDALGNIAVDVADYSPSTNGGQAMELLKEFNMTIFAPKVIGQDYWVAIFDKGRGEGVELEEAICRAVIDSHYGDEVSVSDEPEGAPDDEL